MDEFLRGKRVLFIGYEYYNYHTEIQRTLEKAGARVHYIPVMPYGIAYTLLRNTSTKLFWKYNRAYANSILRRVQGETFDYVFVIQGFQLPGEFYTRLREMNPNARFLNYHWDSVRQTVYGNTLLDIVPYFDRVYSFDRKDCEQYEGLHYLPLFYTEAYAQIRETASETEPDIDLLFIGSLSHYRRYQYVQEIERKCKEQGIRFIYYLCVSRRRYIRYLLRGLVLRNVCFKSLATEQIVQLYRRSKVVIDLPNQVQTGLTMRVFEVLGAGKKLITTNADIMREPFYGKDVISVISSGNLSLDCSFVRTPAVPWNGALQEYSLASWIRTIFTGG